MVALGTINVHRGVLRAEPIRAQIAARVQDDQLIAQICDPMMHGLLPGAVGATLESVHAAFASNGIAR